MTDKRGLLFFSHHQVVSAWDEKPYTGKHQIFNSSLFTFFLIFF
jgi:hypothetical protein